MIYTATPDGEQISKIKNPKSSIWFRFIENSINKILTKLADEWSAKWKLLGQAESEKYQLMDESKFFKEARSIKLEYRLIRDAFKSILDRLGRIQWLILHVKKLKKS